MAAEGKTLLMRWLLLLCLFLPVRAEVRLPVEGLDVRFQNAEVTSDQRNFLVHVLIRNPGKEVQRVYWQDYFTLVNARGEALRPPTDGGVDQGQGLVRTFGSWELAPGGKARMLIYFPLVPGDLPVKLRLSDERELGPYR